jgi:hypothetical protein
VAHLHPPHSTLFAVVKSPYGLLRFRVPYSVMAFTYSRNRV